jgi:uncharacterized ferredoxin-like protein
MYRTIHFCALIVLTSLESATAATYTAGVASVDITPTTPIRLSGYGNRTEETTEVKQRLFVKALALRVEGGEAAVLITVDNCAVNLKIAGGGVWADCAGGGGAARAGGHQLLAHALRADADAVHP